MSAHGFTLTGYFYDGRQPLRRKAVVLRLADHIHLRLEHAVLRYALHEVRVSPRIGVADRFIAFPDGGQFQCADGPALDHLPQQSTSEGAVAWLEQRVAVALASVVLMIALLAGGYQYGLPWAAERVAARLPLETETGLGGEVLAWMDANEWFTPSRLDEETRSWLHDEFTAMTVGLRYERYYALAFRDSKFIGANAFALPGGTIVLTDDMVHLSESDTEVLAVLAHEIGHIEQRHVMRHILQNSVVAVAASAITGDAATLSVAVAGLPTLLAQAEYSRDFETEADTFGFQLMLEHGMSPVAFAEIMSKLDGETDSRFGMLNYLASHPVTAERIERARRAAEDPASVLLAPVD